jgi:glycosyltransferase involved in cell wall biosynthesis
MIGPASKLSRSDPSPASRPTISAALIVRNEERYLEGCLTSLGGQVDEIIVVDTGSTDDTIRIAKRYGAQLLHRPWTKDFSAARNSALDAASGDWILYIDADERLRLPAGVHLHSYIERKLAAAAFVQFMPRSGFTRYRDPRLFLNHPDIRFRGRIHETVMPDVDRMCMELNLSVILTEAKIDHLGYDGDQFHKHPRNLPLLQAELQQGHDRVYYYYHLAETYAALGDTSAAQRTAREGLDVARRSCTEKNRADASLIYQMLARICPKGHATLEIVEEGLERLPSDHALRFHMALLLAKLGRHAEALPHLRLLQAIDPDTLNDGLLAFDRRIFGTFAWQLAGSCLMATGRRDEALQAFHAAANGLM